MASTSTDRRQGVNVGAAVKVPVKSASTANLVLSGAQTVDGVALVANDRVLVKDQTTASENGIYKVATSAWSRDVDFDGTFDVKEGTFVYVTDGATTQGFWYVTTADPITPGTTSLTFARASSVLAAVSAFVQTLLDDAEGGAFLITLEDSVTYLNDDFLGDEIDGNRWQSIVGTDAQCVAAIVLADQVGGVVRLTTGDDAAASMAVNGVQLCSHLNWRPSNGGLVAEGRIAISAITNVAVFLGLTDQRSALEMPFTLAAGDVLTSNASNAVGVLFDTAADNDTWWLVGVATDVDAAKQNTALSPVAGTYETFRIELTAAGVATFYRNGASVGVAMAAAVTAGTQLTPVIAAFSRAAASRNVDCDRMRTKQTR